jgi:alpha-mannosidase
VQVRFVLSEKGEVNRPAWENGLKAFEEFCKDPGITAFSATVRFPERAEVVFPAAAVPEHGYRTFWVRPVEKDSQQTGSLAEQSDQPPHKIENEFLCVEAQADGSLDVLDKASGILYRAQNRLVDCGDHGDEYNYSALENDEIVQAKMTGARIERSEARQVLEVSFVLDVPEELADGRTSRGSKRVSLPIKSRITLAAGVPRADIQTEFDNHARDHRLRVHFAAPFATEHAYYDGHFEIVERPIDVIGGGPGWDEQPCPQVPQRAFTAITNGKNGLLIANRGLPEAETLRRKDGQTEIAVTLLRCVGWLSRDDLAERNHGAGPGMETPGAQVPGKWVFDYAIIPYQADKKFAAYAEAYAFEAPLQAIATTLHAGKLPGKASFIQVEPEQFVISAVKTSEDGRGWVVRGYNLGGEEIKVRLKSLLPILNIDKINIAEEKLEEIKPGTELVVKGNQVVSILLS